jgi:cell division protein FtsB
MDESEIRRQLVEVIARQASLIDALSRSLQELSRELESLKGKIKDRQDQEAAIIANSSRADPRTVA